MFNLEDKITITKEDGAIVGTYNYKGETLTLSAFDNGSQIDKVMTKAMEVKVNNCIYNELKYNFVENNYVFEPKKYIIGGQNSWNLFILHSLYLDVDMESIKTGITSYDTECLFTFDDDAFNDDLEFDFTKVYMIVLGDR